MSRSRRSALISMTGLLASTSMVVALAPVPAAAATHHPASGRAATCAEAWSLIATESKAMAAEDAAAWQRLSDGFLSISDASFNGPVSNAAGSVSASSADIAAALTADAEADPSLAAYQASLGALGTACAELAVSRSTEKVPKFQRFAFQRGTVSGLSAVANAQATALVSATVDRTVAHARKANAGPCLAGAKSCGYFVARLDQRPCVSGVVCLRQVWGLLPVGANDSEGVVDALPIDAMTGRLVPLRRVLPATATPAFLTGLNAAVQKKLAAGGLGNDPMWDTTLRLKDVHAWLPQPDGIHVWFERYAVAPGSFGIVHVVVPWPEGTRAGR